MELSEIEIGLLSCLGLFFFVQIFYYLYHLSKPWHYKSAIEKGEIDPGTEQPPVSVIICARNESENLSKYLPEILEQDYPDFQVIVINDGSSDESEQVLGMYETRYPNLYQTYTPSEAKHQSRKKLAISIGIKAAKHDILLFTEAYCKPISKDWIKSMVRNFTGRTEIVLGFCGVPKSRNFIGKLAAFDNLFTSLQYLSSAINDNPYRGVGRNLAYRKELFFNTNGYRNHLNLHSGEDDLFINETANDVNTKVEISDESIVNMVDFSFQIWKEMKTRQIITKKYYEGKSVTLWNIEAFSKWMFYGFAVANLIIFFNQPIIAGACGSLILLRWIVQGIVMNKSAKKLQTENFYWTLPLIDLGQMLFNVYFRIYQAFNNK